MPRATISALCLTLLLLTVAAEAGPGSHSDTMKAVLIKPGFASKEMSTQRQVLLGAYDPHEMLRNSRRSSIEHVFVYWQAIDRPMLAAKMGLAKRHGRTFMMTVEPYTKAPDWRSGGDRLFAEIVSGAFDEQIATVCRLVADYPAGSWIRWGHEMEQPSDRYPWARDDAPGYIAAYRYFVKACRKIVPEARFMWSPKGEPGLPAYYPGDAYVDLIGLSVWGLERWDRDLYGRPRGFAEALKEKYSRVERFRKPVIVAELGVAGRKSYRRDWMQEISALASDRSQFPLLAAFVYFNDKEPSQWPGGYGSPDWRMTASELAP